VSGAVVEGLRRQWANWRKKNRPCVQLASEGKMGNKRSTQPKNKEKRGRKKYEFCLGGYFWHLGVIFGTPFETCCVSH
jgi:hypothetical protein